MPAIVEKYIAYGKAVCMRNPRKRVAPGKFASAIPDMLKRQWDYSVEYAKKAQELAIANNTKVYDLLPDMDGEMLLLHFMEHTEDVDIQNARNRIFVAEACSRKRRAVEKLWDQPTDDENDEAEDRQKEHMAEYMKYHKMYSTMTHESAGSAKRSDTG